MTAMNREQIRKAAKESRTDTKALRRVIEQVQTTTRKYDVHAYSVALASVLTDKFDFDKEKAQLALKYIGELFDAILQDYTTIKEYEDVLRDEYDIVIQ